MHNKYTKGEKESTRELLKTKYWHIYQDFIFTLNTFKADKQKEKKKNGIT